jgi:hypothetical protein
MAAKRPKGELPKRTSGYADYLKERRPNISKSAAAAQAGRVREKGYDTSAFKKAAPAKPAAKPAARSKSGASTVAAVAKRFGVTAREARDIATALGTAATNVKTGATKSFKTKDVENIKRQVKETARAAVTGKKGTASNLSINAWPSKKDEKKYDIEAASYKKGKGKSSDAFIVKGKKRK